MAAERGRPVLLVALLAMLCAVSVARAQSTGTAAPRSAPDFTRTDLSGTSIGLRSYRGKLVLLNFWATWCAPCLSEIPRFAEWQRRYGPAGLQILGVSMDEDPAPVRAAYQKFQLNYPVVMGDAQLGELFGGVLGLPFTYLIDPRGRIVDRFEGEPDLKRMEARIQGLLPHAPRT
jgi:cytochrome c biogenesis protein CcmG, thiol:disulfide interchange protein DsbE